MTAPAKKRYAEKIEVIKTIWLHKINDADVIEWLDRQPSKSSYIKRLIREDMKRSA